MLIFGDVEDPIRKIVAEKVYDIMDFIENQVEVPTVIVEIGNGDYEVKPIKGRGGIGRFKDSTASLIHGNESGTEFTWYYHPGGLEVVA